MGRAAVVRMRSLPTFTWRYEFLTNPNLVALDRPAPAAGATLNFEGVTYYFCTSNCAEAFENEPEKYLTSSP